MKDKMITLNKQPEYISWLSIVAPYGLALLLNTMAEKTGTFTPAIIPVINITSATLMTVAISIAIVKNILRSLSRDGKSIRIVDIAMPISLAVFLLYLNNLTAEMIIGIESYYLLEDALNTKSSESTDSQFEARIRKLADICLNLMIILIVLEAILTAISHIGNAITKMV